jgi:cytochrome c oxidase cbb3-type subunit 4
MSNYEIMQRFAASFGLGWFGLIAVIAFVYALLPSRRDAFDAAARIPLRED